MKFPKEDFPLIRTAVILLAMVIILSIVGIAGSIYVKDLMQKNKNKNQGKLADTRTKLTLVREEEQQIRLYHAKYLKLVEDGMLAKEDRLAWIENLGAVHKNRKLFGLNYQIEAQQPVQADAALPQGNLALYGSTMKLTFSLLHEEDLLNALNEIRSGNRGLSLLRECTLTRTDKDTGMSVSPHLKAECTLGWLSLAPKPQADIETETQ